VDLNPKQTVRLSIGTWLCGSKKKEVLNSFITRTKATSGSKRFKWKVNMTKLTLQRHIMKAPLVSLRQTLLPTKTVKRTKGKPLVAIDHDDNLFFCH